MARRSIAKRLLRAVMIAGAAMLLIAATMPVWFPWVLRPVLKHYGARFDGYERLGFARFAVTGLRIEREGVRFAADRVELAPRKTLHVSDWQLQFTTKRPQKKPVREGSTFAALDGTENFLRGSRRWLPVAHLANGVILTGSQRIEIASAEWIDGRLSVAASHPRWKQKLMLDADSSAGSPYHVHARLEPLGLEMKAVIRREQQDWRVDGEILWESNRAELAAQFGREGRRPQQAMLRAESLRVPAKLLKLEGYEDLTGSLLFQWETNQFVANVSAAGPVEINLQAHGDVESAIVEQLKISTPWLQADLSDPVRISRTGKLLSESATLRVTRGEVQGTIRVQPAADRLPHVSLELQLAESLAFAATAEVDLRTRTLTFAKLNLLRGEDMMYRLAQPFTMTLREGIGVEGFRWVGTEREVTLAGQVEWPRRGKVETQWRGVKLADFMRRTAGDFTVAELNGRVEWDDSPAVFKLEIQGGMVAKGQTFLARADFSGDAKGLKIESLSVEGQDVAVVSAQGKIPLILMPSRWPQPWQVIEQQAIDLRVATKPEQAFWDRLATLTGVQVIEPDVELSVTGRLNAAEGHLQAHVRSLDWERLLPKIENLRVEAVLNRQHLALETFQLEVEGQPVRLSGELPLGTSAWKNLLVKRTLPDWRQASVRLQIEDAKLAAFVRYLPAVLAPDGRLNADLAVQPGGKLNGTLTITNAATRPLAALGPIRDIQARVQFADSAATIETFDGLLGGERVSLTGRIGFPESGTTNVDLTLRGKNVPLARQPGLVLRSDLDVRFTQSRGRPLTVTGDLQLRDSVFFQDLGSFVPVGLASPRHRPPYFSVEEGPLADWKLDLKIRGDRFMRMRSPLFRGEVSASFTLTGTMREPVALGETRVYGGVVQFPFASLRVEQGWANLTSAHPYRPELFLNASGRCYGYNVTMLARGPVDAPVITFSSMPPLSSEEIVLMLTAGEIPRNELATTQQQRAGRLAMFFGRQLLMQFGADEAAAERLEIRTGEELTEQATPTYYLEYRLDERWSVTGEYDRFNALNAGLKWRLYSK